MIIKFNPEHAKITSFCSKDEFRPAMLGVLVIPEPDIDLTDAKWFAIATDSFKAIKVPVNVELDDNDLDYTEKFKNGIILSRNIVEHHFKSMKATVNFIEVVFNVNDTVTSFNSSNNEKVVGVLINEAFPPAFGMFKDLPNKIKLGFNSTNLNTVNTFLKDKPMYYNISPDCTEVIINTYDDSVQMLLAPIRNEDGTAGFIGHNIRLENAITDINNDIRIKRTYLATLTDTSAINRTLDAIRALNHQKFEHMLRTIHINSMHPCDVSSRFFIEDIEELGFEIPDDVEDVIDGMRDAIANVYKDLLRAVLERLNAPKGIVLTEVLEPYLERVEELTYEDLEEWVNEIESVPEDERTRQQMSDRLYYLGLMNDIENGTYYEPIEDDGLSVRVDLDSYEGSLVDVITPFGDILEPEYDEVEYETD